MDDLRLPFFRYLLSLIARSFERGPALRIAEATSIIMPELHQHIISGMDILEHFLPKTLRQKNPAAATRQGAIFHLDPARVKEGRNRSSPTDLSGGVVLHGGITNEEQMREALLHLRVRAWDGPAL